MELFVHWNLKKVRCYLLLRFTLGSGRKPKVKFTVLYIVKSNDKNDQSNLPDKQQL